MNIFNKAIDPLSFRYSLSDSVVINSTKREIKNILYSYNGWYDAFCELIQNGLDAIDKRMNADEEFNPTIKVKIDIKQNQISVTDNGIGFTEDAYMRFLAPNVSFKSEQERGYKGVGATYLAYGFNYLKIATKNDSFTAQSIIENARIWLSDESPAGNPQLKPDNSPVFDSLFNTIDKGTCVCVKFDKYTNPKDLDWIKVSNATCWLQVLRLKTALGAPLADEKINIIVEVISKEGTITTDERKGINYFSISEVVKKSMDYKEIVKTISKIQEKQGVITSVPSKLKNLDAITCEWNSSELIDLLKITDIYDLELIKNHNPRVILSYVFSVNVWTAFHSSINLRDKQKVIYGGIQIASNNMPQGELEQIFLTKNIGRQNQAYIIIHFDNCISDLGRKGFQKIFSDFSQQVARRILDGPIAKIRYVLRPNTGATVDLGREEKLSKWKETFVQHEKDYPLILINNNFFKPTNSLSVTSYPTREQDVISLFNQLIAGGVIRGIQIMSTNEMFIYDGLFKLHYEQSEQNNFIYDEQSNPLGVQLENINSLFDGRNSFTSIPKILEYKLSLDGLIADLGNGEKSIKDIDLVVAWSIDEQYKEQYNIETLLIPENLQQRPYHGITHKLLDENGNRLCEMIILQDLIDYLKGNSTFYDEQREKYEE